MSRFFILFKFYLIYGYFTDIYYMDTDILRR